MTTTKSAPRFIDDTHVQVTKEFAKKARTFGTPEYKLWKEIRQDCPNAQMVTKKIKKNPNKKTNRNMTYPNMALFIKQQENAEEQLKELERQIALSKVEANPYHAVLAWFEKTYAGHNSYKAFFAQKAEEEAQKKNIFKLHNAAGDEISIDDDDEVVYEVA